MRVPFRYQTTEFDCVPTSFINALQYLFEQKEIPPVVIQKIILYSLDSVNKYGEHGKRGTTNLSIQLITQWLGSLQYDKFAFKRCEYLEAEQVHFGKGNEILPCLDRGGVALLRLNLSRSTKTEFHYVLALGVDKDDSDWMMFFDPYYRVKQYSGEDAKYIQWLGDRHGQSANLKIKRERLDSYEYDRYSMTHPDERVCCILERK